MPIINEKMDVLNFSKSLRLVLSFEIIGWPLTWFYIKPDSIITVIMMSFSLLKWVLSKVYSVGVWLGSMAQEGRHWVTHPAFTAQSFLKSQAHMSALRDTEWLLNKVLSSLFQCFPRLTIRKFSQSLTQICLEQCKPTAFYPIHDGHGKWIISSFFAAALYVRTSRLPASSLPSPAPWARQHAVVLPQVHNS